MPQQSSADDKEQAHHHIGSSFVELQSIDSTNNYARAEIANGNGHHGIAYFAHKQLAGKGQRGKTWISEEDSNIALTVVINPAPLDLSKQFQLNFCISVSLREFFAAYGGDGVKIKWPNDLYWKDKKAGGLLIENITRSGKWLWSIIGIGVNINQEKFPPELPNPVSLYQITGKKFDPLSLAKELCQRLDHRYQQLLQGDFASIFEEYNSHLYKRNEPARLRIGNSVSEVIIKSVSNNGKLIVKDGIEKEYASGEVEWLM